MDRGVGDTGREGAGDGERGGGDGEKRDGDRGRLGWGCINYFIDINSLKMC